MKRFRFALLVLAGLMLAPLIVRASTITRLTMSGPAGEYISQGRTYVCTPDDGPFLVTHDSNNGISINFHTPSYSDFWTVQVGGPHASTPQMGTYANCTRYGSNQNPNPGLAVFGDGRGCNQDGGTFTIKQLVYSQYGVESLWVVFDQCCDNCNGKILHGEFLYNVDSTTPTLTRTWGQLKSIYR